MKDAVTAYLALRRAAGFEMASAEYLLGSFAIFAGRRNETHVQTQTAIEWAAHGPSVAQRDARLKRSVGSPVTSAPKTIDMSCHPRTILDAARRVACRTSTHPAKSATFSKPRAASVLVAR